MRKPDPTTFFEFRVSPIEGNCARVEWFDPVDASRICNVVVPVDTEAHKAAVRVLISARTGFYWPATCSIARYWPDEMQEPAEIAGWRAQYAVSEMPDVEAAIAAEVYHH